MKTIRTKIRKRYFSETMRKNMIEITAGSIGLLIATISMSSCAMQNLGSLEGTYRLPSGKGVVTINIPLSRVPLLRPKLPEPPVIPVYEPEPEGILFPLEQK
jgi:hypothetical protein